MSFLRNGKTLLQQIIKSKYFYRTGRRVNPQLFNHKSDAIANTSPQHKLIVIINQFSDTRPVSGKKAEIKQQTETDTL